MDTDKIKRRQSLKVIISEAIMVLVVIVTVVILAFVVSGYWLNSDFKVERQGMLQVHSVPTGAELAIDGETNWLQRTNTSKVLPSGEHTIKLTKEGYDSWSKTVNISEGLLYRIYYPRLFWQERQPESVLDTADYTFATISPDSESLLLIGSTTEWSLVDLRSDQLQPKKLNVSDYFSGVTLADGATVGLLPGKILDTDWDQDGNHVLVKLDNGGATDWALIDVRDVKNSLNLTKEFGDNFTKMEILDNSASNLLAVQNGDLRRIDVGGKSVSAVLVEAVNDFDHYDNEIVFSAKNSDANSYTVGLFKLGDKDFKKLETVDAPTKVDISKFYDDTYITSLQGAHVALHKKVDYEPVASFDLSFTPTEMEVGIGGAFVTMYDGVKIATLDMEITAIREWQADGSSFDWLDNSMIYSVADGELVVYDFDGYNQRKLARNVSSHFPVTITDNKWLYYFSDGDLIREKIVE